MKLFRRKSKVQKTFIPTEGCQRVFNIDLQMKLGQRRFTTADYIDYYESISPLADAIDLLATQFSAISPRILNSRTKLYESEHPLLVLLTHPNTTIDYLEFAEQSMTFFELTGNCFWIVTTSRLDGEPLELFCIPPQWVNGSLGSDGYVAQYNYSPPESLNYSTFSRIESMKGSVRFRYVSEDGTKELFHLKRINPNSASFNLYGLSKLRSLTYQLEHFRDACLHNIAMLRNGARPSGMLTTKDGETRLSPDQWNNLKAELNNTFNGVSNTGRVIFTDNLEWIPFSVTNKDMDYIEARKQLKEEIYNRLKIPLSLINSNALSLANMEVSGLQLFDLAIIPTTNKIFSVLTAHLMFRYGDSSGLSLTYDPSTIPTLRERTIDELVKMNSLSVMTDNEKRKKLDLPESENSEADNIFKPSTVSPSYLLSGEGMSTVDTGSDGDIIEEPTDEVSNE